MRHGAAIGIGVAVAAVAALALASGSRSDRLPPSVTHGPMQVGRVYVVAYAMPAGMAAPEATALLSFVGAWGKLLGPPEFAPSRDGTPTATVKARVEVAQPSGPPAIPARVGALTPIAWLELLGEGVA